MAQITDLKDLLKHEILDLYSAEEQIIEALPKMVEKASNADLKKALNDHLKVTELQKKRLDEIKELMGESEESSEEKKGFFSKLFGGSEGEKCKGTEGLIKEGEKMMGEDMTEEVMDAAIIGSAQKIEHYEISGYGTAAAYARELGLSNVAGLLQQTLDEEYAADDSLTKLAVGKLNIEAENPSASSNGSSTKKSATSKSSPAKKAAKSAPAKVAPSKSAAPKRPVAKSSPSKSAASKSGSASKSKGAKVVSKSGASKARAPKKSASKASPSKSSKSSGNKSSAKSVPKAAGKKSATNVSTSRSKAGKSKSSKKR